MTNAIARRGLEVVTRVWRALPMRARRVVVHSINDRFPVGVVGVVHDGNGRVLLLEHRFRHPYPWGLPGGFIHHGETLEAALRRELREELALELDEVDRTVFDTELNVGARYVSLTLLARAQAAAKLVLSGEITGGGFFGPGELPAETYPHQAAIVERFWRALRHPPLTT